ncbi:MAG: hypothetical protein JXQ65_05830 [Candidatus Marinimicrobia bacterium]|nr:hypothetical protein [Candidatus Neomarinimicrobiota bacterium]
MMKKLKEVDKIPFKKTVFVRINIQEKQLRQIVKSAGARWTPEKQCWQMSYDDVFNLGLEARIAD